ncbi:amidohydrolase family protein [Candidatus Gottesmanbacteria bacterium]|nr:amidohydrolase family protein [Candidatus Gottesmanbacteria bacterium]
MGKPIRLPGLIDIHVHFRDPGQTDKEDFYTGTSAALAGGVTTVFDMPNNLVPIFTLKTLLEKMKIAEKKAVCDYGFYFGTDGKNITEFEKVKGLVIGLKVYLTLTTGKYLLDNGQKLEEVFESWPKEKVIVVHGEGDKIDLAINLAKKYKNKVHITHVSKKNDLQVIIEGKKTNSNITCDVTPHHLFLSKEQISAKNTSGVARRVYPERSRRDSPDGGGTANGFYEVKPPLASRVDQDFLWEHLKDIDAIATDHAPHTIEEKKSNTPPSGMPGVETTLPLLFTAVKDGRLTMKDLIRLTNTNPQMIFGFRQNKNTCVEIDPDEKYTIENENLKTKCSWSPFARREVYGRVQKVFIRGEKVFEKGKILAKPGLGRNILSPKSGGV